jgi:glycosyl transferase family 25
MFDIHVISLPSSGRRPSIGGILEAHGTAFHFEDAVDARILPDSEIRAAHDEVATRLRYGRPLTRGELGCFMSHRSVWRKIVASGRPAVILEDDASPESAFFEQVLDAPADELASVADIILLGRSKLLKQDAPRAYFREPLKRSRRVSGLTVGTPFKQWTSGSVGYWISVAGARKVLAHTEGAIGALLDDWPWHRDHGGVRVLELRPYAIWEDFTRMPSAIESARREQTRGRPRLYEVALEPLRAARTAGRWLTVLMLILTASRDSGRGTNA